MKKWYSGIYRRHLMDMHINDTDDAFLSRLSADEYFENLKKAKIQSPMIYLQSHTGLCNYETATARAHKRFLSGENEIKRLISLCKNDGMKVVGYYSLIFNNVAADMHPEWEMRKSDGTTWRDEGRRYGLCCPNNEEYRAFVKAQIDELAHEFCNLDGIFFDMPYWEVVCTCDACKKRFFDLTGKKIPSPDMNDPDWLAFMKARQDFMVDFVRFVRGYTNEKMPGVTVEFNYAAVIGCDWLGGSTEGINEECEFTGGDIYGDLYAHSFVCKYYYTVSKNQPFEYMTCRCDKTLREHTILKPEKTLEREIMLTAAHHGASLIIDAIDPVGTMDGRTFERIGEAFSRQIPYERYMDIGKMYAECAVYFDSKTMFSQDGGERYNKLCAIGAVRTLIENHIPVAVIANGAMNDLSAYKMIIAPSLRDFDNDEPLKLIDYVRGGGTLYLSGRSDSRLIKEFFGATVSGTTYEGSPYAKNQLGARTYISPVKDGTLGEFTGDYPLPLTYNLPVVERAVGDIIATVTLPYCDPDEYMRYASIHSCPPWQGTDMPAIIEKKYGKGKVIWCIAEIEYDRRSAIKKVFSDIVLNNVERKYCIKAGKAIEAIIFEGANETLISLCDLEYDEDKINAPASFKICEGRVPKGILDAKDDSPIEFTYTGGFIGFTVEPGDFKMIKIEF